MIEQLTDTEKLKMYLKCSKLELAKMLIEANKVINYRAKQEGDFKVQEYEVRREDLKY